MLTADRVCSWCAYSVLFYLVNDDAYILSPPTADNDMLDRCVNSYYKYKIIKLKLLTDICKIITIYLLLKKTDNYNSNPK